VDVAPFPRVRPMLASTGPPPSDARGWHCELKFDGFRQISFVNGADVPLRVESRSGRHLTGSLPELGELPAAVGTDAVLDGELVVLGAGGRPDFYALGPRLAASRPVSVERARRRSPVTLAIFDLLWLDGRSLMGLSYRDRRRQLEDLALDGPSWFTVPSWPGVGDDLLEACSAMGLEGLVIKRLDNSPYRPGQRARHWVKRKCPGWNVEHGLRRHPGRRSLPR